MANGSSPTPATRPRRCRRYPLVVPSRPTTDPRRTATVGRSSLPPAVLRWSALDGTGVVDAVVTTRLGGVSHDTHATLNLGLHVDDDVDAVIENRRRAAATLGCGIDDLVVAEQVHGRRVTVVSSDDAGRGGRTINDAIPATDALVTTAPDLALVILVADCVPLILVDPVARVLAGVHAGWRGTAAGVTTAAVDTMVDLGADPARIIAGIGPAVDPDDYEVGDEVATALTEALGDAGPGGPAGDVVSPTAPGRWRCDLVAANTVALLDRGIAREHIHPMPVTTAHPDLFSHRRGDRGRFAAMARLTATNRPTPRGPA